MHLITFAFLLSVIQVYTYITPSKENTFKREFWSHHLTQWKFESIDMTYN